MTEIPERNLEDDRSVEPHGPTCGCRECEKLTEPHDERPSPSVTKRYLGDGAYVDFDGYQLILTAEDGIRATARVALEPSVYAALVAYVADLRERTK